MRIVFVSDTHGKHDQIEMPQGDVLVHSGDICAGRGSVKQIISFNQWLGTLNYKNIIVIPGNHDFPFQEDFNFCKSLLSNCNLLFDGYMIVDGIKFYGSPWQPEFCSWAFNLPRGAPLAEKWSLIPVDTDILITHGPPHKILDKTTYGNENAGCEELIKRIKDISPKIHCFGHIHEGYGTLNEDDTLFINASICTLKYNPDNKPIVIDIDEETKQVTIIE